MHKNKKEKEIRKEYQGGENDLVLNLNKFTIFKEYIQLDSKPSNQP